MRKCAALLLACATTASAGEFVDLDRPGALDRLKDANPAHYDRAVGYIRAASILTCKETTVRQAGYDPAEVGPCRVGLFLATYPPKRRVSFEIEGTHYMSNVAIEGYVGKLVPVDALERPR